ARVTDEILKYAEGSMLPLQYPPKHREHCPMRKQRPVNPPFCLWRRGVRTEYSDTCDTGTYRCRRETSVCLSVFVSSLLIAVFLKRQMLIFPRKENYTDTTASEGDVFHSIPGCPSPETYFNITRCSKKDLFSQM
ncbi:hypothetical protein A6R68_10993, partial [Neotoma lepida]